MKVVGFVLVAFSIAFFACAWRQRRASARRGLLITVLALWAVSSLGFVALLAFEHANVGPASMDCAVPGSDSDWVASRWSWIRLGEICEYPTGDIGPSYWRIPILVVLVSTPIAAIAVWPKRRTVPQNDEVMPEVHST